VRKLGEKAAFKSISIKADLVEEVERLIKESGRYRSLAEFFSEAARLRLESLQETTGKKVDISEAPAAC